MKRFIPFLSLFASFGTLVCCALPALMVSLGLGATLAATVSAVPQLVWISEHKIGVFLFAGVMIALGFQASRYGAAQACPTDPELARACAAGKSFSRYTLIFSAIVYLIGAFFAFAAPYLFS